MKRQSCRDEKTTMKQRLKDYLKKKEEIREKLWFRILDQVINLALAAGTVLPLLYRICTTIPFSYEVNDDAVIVQILDGSFTGTPEAHAIFVRYPLSWIITGLAHMTFYLIHKKKHYPNELSSMEEAA